MIKVLLIGIVFCIHSNATQEQLNFLYGFWEGQSTQTMPDGEVLEMQAKECVYPKHEGRLGIVEGLHIKSDGAVGFKTFAILSPRKTGDGYRFNIYLNDGTERDAEAQIDATKKTWDWAFDIKKEHEIKIRYAIKIEEDTWIETGESSADGGTSWRPFFKMKLNKTANACSGF